LSVAMRRRVEKEAITYLRFSPWNARSLPRGPLPPREGRSIWKDRMPHGDFSSPRLASRGDDSQGENAGSHA
jgi:hypothetical protein